MLLWLSLSVVARNGGLAVDAKIDYRCDSRFSEYAGLAMAAIISKSPYEKLEVHELRKKAELAAAGAVVYATALIEELSR